MTRDRAMRVVMYDPGSFLPYYVDALSRGLAALGVRPRVIASPPLFEPVDPGGVYDVDPYFFPFLRGAARAIVRRRRILRLGIKGLAYPAGVARSWRALRHGPPGVLHLQWAPIPSLDIRLVRALRDRGWRIVYTVHDPLPSPHQSRLRERHMALLHLADALIVHTVHQREEIAGSQPALRRRVHVIAHGATQFPLPTDAERRSCRAQLGLEPDRPVILFFGQIKPYKGLEQLVSAMPAVVARVPRALLVVAGEPLMPLDGIERRIAELGLHDHVSLRLRFVPESEAPRYLRGADMLVTPYVRAGASGVVMVAQGHGLPIVATRVGGLPEFIEDGRTGFLVPPADPPALAAAIARALGSRDALAAMARRAWDRIGRDNRWREVAERTLAAYGGSVAGIGREASDARHLASTP